MNTVTVEVSGTTRNLYDTYGMLLFPFDRPSPTVKEHYVDVPASSESLDFTEVFGIQYNDLDFEMTFTMTGNYKQNYQALKNFLHGKQSKVYISDDSNHYYKARCFVSTLKNNGAYGTVTVRVRAYPYKLRKYVTTKNVTISGTTTVTVGNEYMKTVPTFTATSQMTVRFNNTSFTLKANTATTVAIAFEAGNNTLSVTGSGTLTIKYQEGVL